MVDGELGERVDVIERCGPQGDQRHGRVVAFTKEYRCRGSVATSLTFKIPQVVEVRSERARCRWESFRVSLREARMHAIDDETVDCTMARFQLISEPTCFSDGVARGGRHQYVGGALVTKERFDVLGARDEAVVQTREGLKERDDVFNDLGADHGADRARHRCKRHL